MKKIVTDAHYHIWSDALHLRQLARQAHNRWDTATYVRAAVVMAWTAFETTLGDLLQAHRLGSSFRPNLDAAMSSAGLDPLDWGKGVWQRVGRLNDKRVDYVHRTATDVDLFPDVAHADEAFNTIRAAVADMCRRHDRNVPTWLDDDDDRGWAGRGLVKDYAYAHTIHGGVDPDAPDTIRVTYVDESGEHIYAYEPPTADPQQLADHLFAMLRKPVSHIRVYRGNALELEQTLRMRGAP